MENQIFRKKSMEKITSPEQLNDYIRVSNPGVWMILLSVIILLIGVCVWGIFGHLNTTVPALIVSDGQQTVCYVHEADSEKIENGDSVSVNNEALHVVSISNDSNPVESLGDYAMHIGGFESDDWVCAVTTDGNLPEGVYSADIVIDSISPISFVMN